MANTTLFNSLFRTSAESSAPRADARNEAGGPAYRLSPKHTLAQFAATGCFNSTFYATAEDQLDSVLALAARVEPEFIAKTALYARAQAHMKDAPALLLAVLAVRAPGLFAEVFDRVADNGRVLRTFVQIVRSGVTGRRSLGTLPKRMVRQWLERRTDEQVFFASVGSDPSLADVVKMAHPRPATESRRALYARLIGGPHDGAKLPAVVRWYDAFKRGETPDMPDVPHELLTALPLGTADWKLIAYRASWQTTRMNLNTFARHGVFSDHALTELIAAKLRDPALIARARALPYQLLVAHARTHPAVPASVKHALHDAMETAIGNVPEIPGQVWVFPDVSGSMDAPITGYRTGASSAVRCIDVAALVTAAILRKNPTAEVVPFNDNVVKADLNPRDTVLTNAARLASLPRGGTSCSAPLRMLNKHRETGDLVVYVSDNQSWCDTTAPPGHATGRPTETMREWAAFKERNPNARLVAIDLQPAATVQAKESPDVLHVGGFSDRVFDVLAKFADRSLPPDHWVDVIEQERI